MFDHLLVPVDGTELAERAVQVSLELAQRLGAAITAFIAEPPAPHLTAGHGVSRYLEAMQEHEAAVSRHAEEVLAAFQRRAEAAGVRFEGVYARVPQIDDAIAAAAQQCGCDTIVMVTHGRGAFGELLFGSRTKGVMARSKLPLLVLH